MMGFLKVENSIKPITRDNGLGMTEEERRHLSALDGLSDEQARHMLLRKLVENDKLRIDCVFLEKHRDHLKRVVLAIQTMHQRRDEGQSDGLPPYCDYCRESWPCATIMLIEHPPVW